MVIRVEPSSQAVIGFPGLARPGRRIRRILHNIVPFDPRSRLIISVNDCVDRPRAVDADRERELDIG